MEHYIGKKCFITILKKDTKKKLYYTGTVISVTDLHISFIDKLGKGWTYLIEEVEEVEDKTDELDNEDHVGSYGRNN